MLCTMKGCCDFVHDRILTLLHLKDNPICSMIVIVFLQYRNVDPSRCMAAISSLMPTMTQQQILNVLLTLDAAHSVAWESLRVFYDDAINFESVLASPRAASRLGADIVSL